MAQWCESKARGEVPPNKERSGALGILGMIMEIDTPIDAEIAYVMKVQDKFNKCMESEGFKQK